MTDDAPLAARTSRTVITQRDKEMLARIASGLTSKQVGGEFCISESAVKSRMRAMRRVMMCRNNSHLVAFAFRVRWFKWNSEGRIGIRKDERE